MTKRAGLDLVLMRFTGLIVGQGWWLRVGQWCRGGHRCWDERERERERERQNELELGKKIK
jgi:hypothetical protein